MSPACSSGILDNFPWFHHYYLIWCASQAPYFALLFEVWVLKLLCVFSLAVDALEIQGNFPTCGLGWVEKLWDFFKWHCEVKWWSSYCMSAASVPYLHSLPWFLPKLGWCFSTINNASDWGISVIWNRIFFFLLSDPGSISGEGGRMRKASLERCKRRLGVFAYPTGFVKHVACFCFGKMTESPAG